VSLTPVATGETARGVAGETRPVAEADSLRMDAPDFDSLWNYQNPAETERIFRDLLPQAEASGATSYHLQLLTQIARAISLQGRFDEAHGILDEVEQELKTVGAQDLPLARIRYLLERGRLSNSSGEVEESKPLFLEAWQLALRTQQDCHAIDAAHMLGIVTPPEGQLEWSLRAMETAERSPQECARRWLGPLYHNIGMTYLDLGRHAEALACFEKGWELRRTQGNKQTTRGAKWSVAHALRKMGRLAEALRMQRELEQELAADNESDGFVAEEIAECLLAQGSEDEALPYFGRAYELLQGIAWIAESDSTRLARLSRLGGRSPGRKGDGQADQTSPAD
jgi:tetratricopeptide (TPR) repeat protein